MARGQAAVVTKPFGLTLAGLQRCIAAAMAIAVAIITGASRLLACFTAPRVARFRGEAVAGAI